MNYKFLKNAGKKNQPIIHHKYTQDYLPHETIRFPIKIGKFDIVFIFPSTYSSCTIAENEEMKMEDWPKLN